MLLFKLRLLAVCSMLTVFSCTVYALSDSTTWNELETAAYDLTAEEKIDEALATIDQAAANLKDRDFEISDLRMTILFDAGRTTEAMKVWEDGLDEGFFYFVVPRSETYATVRNSERFLKALTQNNKQRNKANKKSKPEYKVIKPAAYSASETYPMLMIIHGGNQSITKAMNTWDPAAIGDNLLIAYVQSSKQADTKSYRWDLGGVDYYHLPTAQDEVLELYREIIEEYPVDTKNIILAGFSQGGNLALNMAAEGTIPAHGFIAGCPATRSSVSAGTAKLAAERGVRGTIFVGANDWTAETSQTTVDNMKEAGLPIVHLVMEDKGHEYPDNFNEVLLAAIQHIQK